MARRVRLELTEAEAQELYYAANCGYADGDLYQLNNEEPPTKEERKGSSTYWRAIRKLQSARRRYAENKKASREIRSEN